MGLSASQARFLQLTARKNDIEYHVQQITQERLAMAQKLNQVSDEYNDAISNKKLVFTYADSTVHQVDVTYKNYKNYMNQQLEGLTSSQQQLFLVSTSGKIVVGSDEDMQDIIEKNTTFVKASDVNDAINAQDPTDEQKEMAGFDWSQCNLITKEDGESYYVKSQRFSFDDFVVVDDLDNVDLFQQSIREGTYSFATFGKEEDTKDTLVPQEWATVANGALMEQLDESDDAAAEAKYDKESKRLELIDKKLQMQMDELETERDAIKTEMDSIQKVVDDNIQKTFDTFS